MHRSLTRCFFLLLLLGGEAVADSRSLGIVLPEGGESVAYDMNAAGQVAAVIEDAEGVQRGIFFEHGKSIELGSLGGLATEAKHINNKGEIIGSASRKDGNWSAFVYDRVNGMQVLGTLGGATNDHGLTAAAMLSSTPPFVDPGLNRFLKLIAAVLALAGAAIVSRRRYRGILFGAYAD
jgi:probable HAF family extracellular repeat protein